MKRISKNYITKSSHELNSNLKREKIHRKLRVILNREKRIKKVKKIMYLRINILL